MSYSKNKNVIKSFYEQNGLTAHFEQDNTYLEAALEEINNIWLENLNQIKTVNYLMIAEAPLWGQKKKYIYNPEVNNSQFFYRSDLGDVLDRKILDKADFIKVCNEIGLLVVDTTLTILKTTQKFILKAALLELIIGFNILTKTLSGLFAFYELSLVIKN